MGSVGKTGEERALDLELGVLGLVPSCGPEILEHVFTHLDSGRTPSFVYEHDRNDLP